MRGLRLEGRAASGAMPPDVWWNTPTRNITAGPTAVLFFHIGKCGGGSVMQWLMRGNPGFTLRLDHWKSRLFLALHHDLEESNLKATPWQLNGGRVATGLRPDWRHTSVVVEYHSRDTQKEFWQDVLPLLPALRRRYERAGGRLLVLTAVRDPAAHIVSWYRQWPARLPNRSVSAFEPWVANASGLLTRHLAFVKGWPRIWHTTKVPYYACPPEDVAKARDRLLRVFDIVGDVRHVAWTLRTLVGCLHWPLSWLPPAVPHLSYLGGARAFTTHETAGVLLGSDSHGDGERSPEAPANPAAPATAADAARISRVRCSLARASRCDAPLYEVVRGGWCRCGEGESRGPSTTSMSAELCV